MKTKLLFLALGLASISLTAQHDTNWELQNTGFTEASRGASDISIVDENIVWVRAHDGADTDNHIQEFTKTIDGGLTWTPGAIEIGSPASGIAMIHAISATTAWVAAFPYSGTDTQGIYKTTDGGATWDRQNTALYNDAVSFANVVYFWDENIGFAQGDPVDGYYELYTTTDGGDNWNRVPQANIPDPVDGEYGYTSQVFVAGDAMWWTTNKGRIYRSYDHGNNFVVFQSPIEDFGGTTSSGEIAFNDANQGYLTNQAGLLWTTSDGGETWNLVFPGGDGVVFPGDIAAVPNSNVVYVAGAAGDLTGSAVSDDGGATFTTLCDTEQHLDTRFISGTIGWSGTFSVSAVEGGIFKYIGLDYTDTGSIADLEAKGFFAFPNPVVDVLRLSAKENITEVSVHNMLGQEVYNTKPSALNHQIDMSSFPNGTYVVSISIGNVKGSTKIVK